MPHRVGANGPPVWELAAEEFARYVNGGGEGVGRDRFGVVGGPRALDLGDGVDLALADAGGELLDERARGSCHDRAGAYNLTAAGARATPA